MFHYATRPKAHFIMWIMLHKRLATTDRLEKRGVNVSKTCELCNRENEIVEHLMIQCQFTCDLWNRILGWLQMNRFSPCNWDQFILWSVQQGKEKTTNHKPQNYLKRSWLKLLMGYGLNTSREFSKKKS